MFTKSEKIKLEYCAQIVKIGELFPIEGSDFLVKTYINGAYQVVVGKNDVKTGDIMVYCKLETAINKDFLSVNNQFELSERELNKNYDEVQKLLDEGKEDEAKKLVGYFNKHGRVRIIKLRGCASEGCLFPINSLTKWNKKILDYDFEKCFEPNEEGVVVPFEFDAIDDVLFVKAYVPPMKNVEHSDELTKHEKRRGKKIEKLDRMVDGQFNFHYDTQQLKDNLWRFKPETVVDISVKVHGTSFITGKLLTKNYLKESLLQKSKRITINWFRNILSSIDKKGRAKIEKPYVLDYGEVTSSRSVIKNKYINEEVGQGFYGKDIWSDYGKLMYPYLDEGMTVYGEIAGYVSDSQTMIQKGYDYGCEIGENFLMPYRITETDADGNHKEWNVQDVFEWTLELLKEHPELEGKVKPITVLYHGKLCELYGNIECDDHWGENLLMKLGEDKKFKMEKNEPLCNNKVPREGIIIRIQDDAKAEAFKLKTVAFKMREAKLIDSGEVDVEMVNGYGDGEDAKC